MYPWIQRKFATWIHSKPRFWYKNCLLDPGEPQLISRPVDIIYVTEGIHNRNDLERIELLGGKPTHEINLWKVADNSDDRQVDILLYVCSLEANIYLHVLLVYLNYSIPNYLYHFCFSLVEFCCQIHSP
jgi:hypothetical protein